MNWIRVTRSRTLSPAEVRVPADSHKCEFPIQPHGSQTHSSYILKHPTRLRKSASMTSNKRSRVETILILCVIAVLVTSSLGTIPISYATSTTVLDSAGCTAIGGSFSSNTCDITGQVILPAGSALIVPSGDTLTVSIGSGSLGYADFSIEIFTPGTANFVLVGGTSSTSSGSISTCATETYTFTGTDRTSPVILPLSTFTSATVSCSISTYGVPEFPSASLSFVLLAALLLPALLIIGRKFSGSASGGIL
jgi:hypothetical protein